MILSETCNHLTTNFLYRHTLSHWYGEEYCLIYFRYVFAGNNAKYNKNSFLFNDFNKTHGYELSSSSSDDEKQGDGKYQKLNINTSTVFITH